MINQKKHEILGRILTTISIKQENMSEVKSFLSLDMLSQISTNFNTVIPRRKSQKVRNL